MISVFRSGFYHLRSMLSNCYEYHGKINSSGGWFIIFSKIMCMQSHRREDACVLNQRGVMIIVVVTLVEMMGLIFKKFANWWRNVKH